MDRCKVSWLTPAEGDLVVAVAVVVVVGVVLTSGVKWSPRGLHFDYKDVPDLEVLIEGHQRSQEAGESDII